MDGYQHNPSYNKFQKIEIGKPQIGITIQQHGLGDDQFGSQEEFKDEMNDSQYSNIDVQALIDNQEALKNITYEELYNEKKDRKQMVKEDIKQLQEQSERKWLKDRGKKHLIDFDDNERQELKKYFKSLDEDGSGGIGLEELEVPLISLGIADSREEVKKIIDAVDDDGNIKFEEFLIIIKGKGKDKKKQKMNEQQDESQKNAAIVKFFKDMIQGNLGEGSISKSLPFELIVSTLRRKKLMSAIMSEKDDQEKKEGLKVLRNWEKLRAQISSTEQMKLERQQSKKSQILESKSSLYSRK